MFNYGVTYNMYGQTIPMSPDEHFANLKRAISAVGGKAHRITVIMPMLYEGRQHKRSSRESLDCAIALQELCNNMGVDNIITFDAHDPRVQNAIPLKGFENVQPAYQMIKALVNNVDDLHLDKEHMMVVSPDEGGMSRCIYYSTVLGLDLGMFYKRRDYSRVVNGRNPILQHQFLGSNIEGKDVMVVDDMISSGESMLEVAKKLKELGAKRIFISRHSVFSAKDSKTLTNPLPRATSQRYLQQTLFTAHPSFYSVIGTARLICLSIFHTLSTPSTTICR